MKIPRKYEGILFAFIMSLLMALLMSGVLTAVFNGIDREFFEHWANGFVHAWPIAFPAILVLAPVARKIVNAMLKA
jgi:hypothetical protein